MLNGRVAASEVWRPGGKGWALTAALLAVLTGVVSLLPPRGTPGGDIADLGETLATVGHVLAYALTGACFALSLNRRPRPSWWRRGILIAVILTVYGALLELLQESWSARAFQWGDVLANAFGALIGVGAAWLVRRTSP
jgi:VanZ family protein